MLQIDPSKRITTVEALKHPWLRQEEPSELPSTTSTTTTTTGSSTVPTTVPRKITKGSGYSLNHALRQLSGHVGQRKTEKLATGFTKLMSSMQLSKFDSFIS